MSIAKLTSPHDAVESDRRNCIECSMGDMCDSDRPNRRRWNRWRISGVAALTMVLGAFSVLGLKLWYEPSDGLTATERVLVLDADTLKPIQEIPVRFSRHK